MSALAAIHVAKRELGLDDDTYRSMLVRVTGKASAADMSVQEREKVIAEFRRQGFKKPANPPSRRLDGPYAKKLQALWIAAYNLGLTGDRKDRSLLSFVKRQTGIEHTRFLREAAQASRVVEALKAWMTRDAGVDWMEGALRPVWQREHGARIAMAQWHTIHGRFDMASFRQHVLAEAGKPVEEMNGRDWVGIMNALGEQLRNRSA